MSRIISDGLKRAEQKGTYHVAGHVFNVREQVAQVAEAVQWAQEWIESAVQASPEASIAWTAIALGLPLLSKPAAAEQANIDGFTYVTSRMQYYVALESSMLPQSQASAPYAISQDLRKEVEAHVIDLYQHVLDFQVKSVLRFYRNTWGNFGRDLIQREDWKQMLNGVQDLEKIANDDLRQVNNLASRKILETMAQSADTSRELQLQFLKIAEQGLQAGKENLDLSAKQLSIQERVLQNLEAKDTKALSQEEESCLQLFRLQSSGEDQSYEWFKGRVKNRIEGTCHWFLEHDHFLQWLKQDSGPLLVSADPGCGKSVLAKYLIDHRLPHLTASTICYFFFKDQVQNTLRQALCALIHQLFSFKPSLVRHAIPHYARNGDKLVAVTEALWSILHDATTDSDVDSVIFVIDALDECNESDFEQLTRMLKTQLRSTKKDRSKIRYLLTSRPYEQITIEFKSLISDFPSIRIPGEEESERIGQEINCVIKHRVKRLREKGLSEDITQHLEQKLLGIPHRTYLWVYLVFDHLKQGFKRTKKGVEDSIASLPESVNQAYDKILRRSKDQQKVRKILSIILAATRPLTLKEMNVAVNVEASLRPTSIDDLDLEQEDDFRVTLRNSCGLFVSIYDSKVHFLHQTAREFLIPRLSESTIVSNSSRWFGSISLQQAHSVLTEICVVYLELDDLLHVKWLEDIEEDIVLLDQPGRADRNAFLEYSVLNWTLHFHEACIEDGSDILSAALRLCDPNAEASSTWLAPGMDCDWDYRQSGDYPEGLTTLMVASFFGLEKVAALILANGADLKAQAHRGWTALHLAALRGHETLARLLLDQGVDIDALLENGRTALYLAVGECNVTLSRVLLIGGADVNARDKELQTPLHYAAFDSDEAITKLLLNYRADVNARDKDGRTPVLYAARYGDKNEAIMKLLLHYGADINAQDWTTGSTALHELVRWYEPGHGVKVLLENGADVKIQDVNGTPLLLAVQKWSIISVRLLLEKGADLNDREHETGRTLLHLVKYSDMAEFLLGKGMDVNAQDNYGKTAIDSAEERERREVVEVLKKWSTRQ